MLNAALQPETVSAKPSQPAPEQATTDNLLTAAKGGGIIFIGTLFGYAGSFILGLIFARLMGDEQYGLYSLADSTFYLIVGIMPLGLGTALMHFIPVYASRQDKEALGKTLQVSLIIPLILSILATTFVVVFGDSLATSIFHDSRLAPLLRIIALVFPCGTLASIAVAAAQGFKQMQYRAIGQDIALTVLKIVLTILLAITGLTAVKAITAYSLAVVGSCILLIYFFNKLFPLRQLPGFSIPQARKMLKFALPVYMAELLTLFGPNLRTLLLGSLSTVSSVGIFTVALRVTMVGMAFYNSISMIAMPIVSELYANGDDEKLKHFYQTMTKWTFTFNFPFFLLVVFFPQFILSIFGESFVAGATALVILALKDLAGAATGISGVMIVMTGRSWLNTINSIIRLTLTIVLSLWLIPEGGVVGAAQATTLSLLIVDLSLIAEVFVLFRVLPYNREFLKPLIAGSTAAAITYIMVNWVFTDGVWSTLASMAILGLTYGGIIVLLGLSEEDKLIIGRLSQRLNRIPFFKKFTR
ncbi:MAG: flippase [Anaerolineae bacterium]|nr:flippase [Anaerolineae bacterium]